MNSYIEQPPYVSSLEALAKEQEREVASLREQLRLTNDKMEERVRQARWEVAEEALDLTPRRSPVREYLQQVSDANAPKD